MKSFVAGKPYWWQWPTILSLDAPAVAVSWQWILGHSAGAAPSWPEVFVLGCSVWLAYVADRWIEGWRLPFERVRTQRHFFAQRWRWWLFAGWLAAFWADLSVAVKNLSAREFDAGLLLLAATATYLLSHQLLHRRYSWRMPKEICVALLLGAGVAIFLVTQPAISVATLADGIGIFVVLAFANCVLISIWEADVDAAQEQTSLVRQYRAASTMGRLLPWAIALISAILAWRAGTSELRTVFSCAAGSALLLGMLDRAEPRVGRQLARVLADVVLLTPAIPFVRMLLWRR